MHSPICTHKQCVHIFTETQTTEDFSETQNPPTDKCQPACYCSCTVTELRNPQCEAVSLVTHSVSRQGESYGASSFDTS